MAKINKLVIHLFDEQSAVAAVSTIPNMLNIRTKVVRHEYAGIIRMDQDNDLSQIPILVNSVNSTTRLGNTSVVQLKFISKDKLHRGIRHRINIEYCLL